MSNAEALIELKASIEGCGFQCHKETYEKAINALEKQIHIEHHHTRVRLVAAHMRESVCPKCLKIITTDELHYPEYCCWCGQAIDWLESEVETK